MNKHHDTTGPTDEQQQITLRGPAELADALPYMMGYHPTDSIVLVALHGDRGRFGGRVRLGIPRSPREWPPVAEQLAECLIEGCERRASRPEGIVVFLCQDPGEGETGRRVMERLRPLAQRLRTACGSLDVPVYEALCISDGRFWSYCCPDARCCPPEGNALALSGTSVMAAAAAYAGIQVRGSLREMEERLRPWRPTTAAAGEQLRALDTAGAALVPRILDTDGRDQVRAETLALAERLMKRLADGGRAMDPAAADAQDDASIAHEEAAEVILGLQDRETRDRAAEWMEGPEAAPALRLWRALARRCVGAYTEHSAAPLTLAGWVAWSTGDEPGARVALGLALEADAEYVFARLLHQACNEGLDPESLRRCLREERDARAALETRAASASSATSAASASASSAASGASGAGTPAGGRASARTAAGGARARVRMRKATGGARKLPAARKAGRRPQPRPVRLSATGTDPTHVPPGAVRPDRAAARARARTVRRAGRRGTRSGR
ncbi:DUF4192 domain-containing protein [Streptomyces ficellus]|uniref:DUF4192 domain-containing protein n=1 Tax=Streptomyces ficellus TaxID=1977088 RepID=A0ABT7YZM3_9ACTN|nr:DUF4192 domain-containing protein [Streptomyces ficellus]MDN3292682.1 DUF4192 domain-containing protein [Streptomyces ficellus]